jgi:hypothetical protein
MIDGRMVETGEDSEQSARHGGRHTGFQVEKEYLVVARKSWEVCINICHRGAKILEL